MATFNGNPYSFASFSPYGYAAIWDRFWDDVLAEMDGRAAGLGGAIPSVLLAWDTGTTDADPGAGEVRGNHATLASITQLFASSTDALGNDVSAVIGLFDDSTSDVKGILRIGHRSDETKWAIFTVTGSVITATGYRKVTVTYVAGPGGFSAADPVALGFVRTGDKGDKGDVGDPGLMVAASDAETLAGALTTKAVTPASAVATFLKLGGGTLTGWLQSYAGVDAATLGLRIGEATSGFYRSAAGVLGFVAGGVEVFRTAASGAILFYKAVRGQIVAVAWTSTVTFDANAGNYFSVTLAGATTVANPSNLTAGQPIIAILKQDGAGNRTASWGSNWKFPSGTAPTLSTAAGKTDRVIGHAVSAAEIHAVCVKGF